MKRHLIACLALFFILAACSTNLPSGPTATPTTAAPPTALPPTLEPASPTPSPTGTGSTAECSDAAAFVADVTIPDYSHFNQHETFTKTWRIRNSGTCTWSSSYKAVFSSGDKLGAPASIPLSDTAPGSTLDISANMAAPAADGKFKAFYQIQDPSGKPIPVDDGDTIWAIITVGKVVVFSSPTPAPTSSASNISTGGATPSAPASCITQSQAEFLSQTVTLINAVRATAGLPALVMNSQLSAAAQAHSVDMACTGSLSHTGSDGSSPATRIAAAGYTASISRENIYAQPPQFGGNPASAMDWWMNSQIHRDAILNSQVTQIGVGYAYYVNSPLGGYFTAVFAAP